MENYECLVVALIKDEIFAFYAGTDCTLYIKQAVARELGLSFRSHDASIVIEAENKRVAMVIVVLQELDQELVLGINFLYLLDVWS